ncbi:hypothetical protein FOZ61_008205, partial [Perkinsus olseni]
MGRGKKGSKAPTSRNAVTLSTGDVLDAARELKELPVSLGPTVTFHRGAKLPKGLLDRIIDITRDNMKTSYDAALGWDNWDDHIKRDEMSHKLSRFLLRWREGATDSRTAEDLVAFVHFRFERADDDDQQSVLYVYEIQVVSSYQRRGIGRELMELVEEVATQLGIDLVMLTCLKNRPEGLAFYKTKLGYTLHPSSPEACDGPGQRRRPQTVKGFFSGAHDKFMERPVLNGMVLLNCVVYGAWRCTALSFRVTPREGERLRRFLMNNFTCSWDDIMTKGRWHQSILYGFSHITFPHFVFNTWLLYFIGRPLYDRLANEKEFGIVYFSGLFAGAVAETLACRNRATPLVGASSGVMALLASLSVLEPNRWWYMLFPIPGATLSSMQLADINLAVHLVAAPAVLYRQFSRRFPPRYGSNVAYVGHLAGIFAGYAATK